MNQSDEDALVNEIFDKSWRTEPGAQTSLFNMAESIRLAIRAAVAAERERDEARELSVQGSARLFAAMNFERDEWKRKAEEAASAEMVQWEPIETAPKDNKRPLLLARFNDDGSLQSIDHDGVWKSESESWEMPRVYFYWASANGNVEEPSHWMYQPEWYAAIAAKGEA